MTTNIGKYCIPDKRKSSDVKISFNECKSNIANMKSFMTPFTYHRSVCIGLWIRDHVKIKNVINEIFVKKFKFNIKYIETKFGTGMNFQIFSQINPARESAENRSHMRHELDNSYTELFAEFSKKSPCIFVYQYVTYEHVNAIFFVYNAATDTYNYMYLEPHDPQNKSNKWYVNYINDFFDELNENTHPDFSTTKFTRIPVASVFRLISQKSYPLCYLYTIYYMLYLYIKEVSAALQEFSKIGMESYLESISKKYIEPSTLLPDDSFITKFARDILKLCVEYTLMEPMTYYILTNNIYRAKLYLETIASRFPTQKFITQFLYMVNSTEMIDLCIDNVASLYTPRTYLNSTPFESNDKSLQIYQNYIMKIISNKTKYQSLQYEIYNYTVMNDSTVLKNIFMDNSNNIIDKDATVLSLYINTNPYLLQYATHTLMIIIQIIHTLITLINHMENVSSSPIFHARLSSYKQQKAEVIKFLESVISKLSPDFYLSKSSTLYTMIRDLIIAREISPSLEHSLRDLMVKARDTIIPTHPEPPVLLTGGNSNHNYYKYLKYKTKYLHTKTSQCC